MQQRKSTVFAPSLLPPYRDILIRTMPYLSVLLFFLLFTGTAAAQTVYTVVLGNQSYVVGSSTLRSGLFVSRDGARTWRHIGPENLKAYSMDAVDSAGGRILYIAAGNGVHRSTDYGQSWKIVTDWRMTEVLDVKVDQTNPNFVYAATAWGFRRSTDGGDTWENPEGPLKDRYCYQLSLADDAGTIAAVGEERRQMIGYVSYDRGATWKALAAPPPTGAWENAYAVVPVPVTAETMMVGFADTTGFRFARTPLPLPQSMAHGGTIDTANISGAVPGAPPIHALALLDEAPADLLAGTFGDGLYRWNGSAWEPAGLQGSQVWRIITKTYTVPVEAGHVH